MVAVLFLLVSLRVADTTTSSMEVVSSSIVKLISMLLLGSNVTTFSMLFRPIASATIVYSPMGRFFRKKCPEASATVPMVVSFIDMVTNGMCARVRASITCPCMFASVAFSRWAKALIDMIENKIVIKSKKRVFIL